MFFNRKKQNVDKSNVKSENSHLNYMGGLSYDLSNPLIKLKIASYSCFFGEPMYYNREKTDKKLKYTTPSRLSDNDIKYLRKTLNAIDPQEWRTLSPAELMEKTIDEALDFDAESTLKEAVRLRNEGNIRVTPQVILVRAANNKKVKGTNLIKKYAKEIILRADEPSTGLAYQLWRFRKPIPNSLKKAWKVALESFDEYQLSKYRMEKSLVSTVDVVKISHPKGELIDKLIKDELKVTDKTWEGIISAKGSNKETWEEALKVMGHMALLRNIRNLIQNNVNSIEFLEKLKNGVKNGKQLPFRYYSAYNSVRDIASPKVLECIEDCINISLENIPYFDGKVMSLCDNSGSATGSTTSSMGSMKISTIGNLMGVITSMRSDEGYVGIFGDKLEKIAIKKKSTIFDVLDSLEKKGEGIGANTENGIWLFWDEAIRKKEKWDYVFVYSDMQAGHGGLYGTDQKEYQNFLWNNSNFIDVPKLINHYRETVNPEVKVFLVQVAGYQDTIIPEFYDKTYILGGWGENLLKFAKEMENNSFTVL